MFLCLFVVVFVVLLVPVFIKGSSDRHLALSRGRWQRAEPVALWSTQAMLAPHGDWFLVPNKMIEQEDELPDLGFPNF